MVLFYDANIEKKNIENKKKHYFISNTDNRDNIQPVMRIFQGIKNNYFLHKKKKRRTLAEI